MRIIHLSAPAKGGAGKAALALHRYLENQGINSLFLTIDSNLNFNNATELVISRTPLERILSFLSSRIHIRLSKTSYFSLWSHSTESLTRILNRVDKSTTIIHVHSWYNMVSLSQILDLVGDGYKVVFTLHDQRLFTGGCHYAIHCKGYENSCSNCPQVIRVLHKVVEKNLSNLANWNPRLGDLVLVTPSKWLLECLSKSRFRAAKNVFIPNIQESFTEAKPHETKSGLSVGVAAMDPYLKIKGGEFLTKLEELVGNNSGNLRIAYLRDFPESQKELFWNSIDYLLVPSIADNSPNVVHEAKLRGIPVWGTQVGGITEMLDPEFDVVLDPKRSVNLQSLLELEELKNSPDRADRKVKMQEKYIKYIGNPGDEYLKVYSKLLRSNL